MHRKKSCIKGKKIRNSKQFFSARMKNENKIKNTLNSIRARHETGTNQKHKRGGAEGEVGRGWSLYVKNVPFTVRSL